MDCRCDYRDSTMDVAQVNYKELMLARAVFILSSVGWQREDIAKILQITIVEVDIIRAVYNGSKEYYFSKIEELYNKTKCGQQRPS